MIRILALSLLWLAPAALAAEKPNIILIYADDLGYGDLGCYGAKAIATPNIDRLAAGGLRFTDAHATSSTCTPSRFALLTGTYPWRQKGTGILQGDAPLIIPPGSVTLPSLLQKAGYRTGVVGKWHLGLGTVEKPADWNGLITPSPADVGFDHHHIMAATGDRVPTVYVENGRVVNLDPQDPIRISYKEKIGNEPVGREQPSARLMGADDQHSDTITHGVSRIGYMSGGKAALWKDEELGDHFTAKAVSFLEANHEKPFFLFFALHEPHVPRVPAPRFVGKTSLGPRGDVIVQIDDHVRVIVAALERLGLTRDTLVLLTSDNGPVLDDGYADDSAVKNGDHKPAGPFGGGKYSKLDGGTRVPLIVSWPGTVAPGESAALFSQVDLLATFAALAGQPVPAGAAVDSTDATAALLGKSAAGRGEIVQQGTGGLAFRRGNWKYIPPSSGPAANKTMRSGNLPKPQLYDLSKDPGENENLATRHPDKLKELAEAFRKVAGKVGK
jgi:arylsulfatase A-like enzyme